MEDFTEIQTGENTAQTVAKLMGTLGASEPLTGLDVDPLTRAALITVPEGRKVEDVTKVLREAREFQKPALRKGTAELEDLASFIEWANRFKGPETAIFAKPDMKAPKLTCVADYHAAGAPNPTAEGGDPNARHMHHQGHYSFPLSDEWKAWMAVSKGREGGPVPLDKDEMGEFIEANAKDIMDPTPAILEGKVDEKNNQAWENRLIQTAAQIEGRYGQLGQLLAMSKQFQVYETSDLSVTTNRDTGETEVSFKAEHRDAAGQKLAIPNLIIIAIPVFRGGAPYRMPVRFRYRKAGGTVKFILSVYNPEKVFEAAFREAVDEAEAATELPTFYGTPER